MEANAYIEERDGGYWISGRRVSLDSVVYAFLEGESAESIARSFEVLTLEEVYGAIAFYLAHRAEIDEYLAQARREYDRQREADRQSVHGSGALARGPGAVAAGAGGVAVGRDIGGDVAVQSVRLRGLFADLEVDVSAEDIEEARREMWGGFPREID